MVILLLKLEKIQSQKFFFWYAWVSKCISKLEGL